MTPNRRSHGKLFRTTKILSHARRRGGGVADRGGSAAYETTDNRIPWHDHAFGLEAMGFRFCAEIAGSPAKLSANPGWWLPVTVVDTRSSWFRNYTTIRTNAFACIVSTAPGLFRPSVLILPVGPDGEQKGWPLAKAYLPRLYFSKKARNIVHDYIVNVLDNSGQDKTKSIGYTLEGVFWVAKARGYIVDYIIAPSAKGDDPGGWQDFL